MINKRFIVCSFVFFHVVFVLGEGNGFRTESITTICPGITYNKYVSDNPKNNVHVVIFERGYADIAVIPAVGQREEVSSIAQRVDAVVAINGGNYRRGGRFNGNRLNLCVIDGDIYTDVGFKRGAVGWVRSSQTLLIDQVQLNNAILIGKNFFVVNRINQPRGSGERVIYSVFGARALMNSRTGHEIVINNGKVTAVNCPGDHYISHNGCIYQVDSDDREVLDSVKVGESVSFYSEIEPDLTSKNDWMKSEFILGGAGLLLTNDLFDKENVYKELAQSKPIVHSHDEIAADFYPQKIQEWLIEQRHPRTAMGADKDGNVYIAVVDGRQESSEGMSLPELGGFMHNCLPCVDALNLGGGGCSTLYINGKIVNSPSQGEERPVSEAICFFSEKFDQ